MCQCVIIQPQYFFSALIIRHLRENIYSFLVNTLCHNSLLTQYKSIGTILEKSLHELENYLHTNYKTKKYNG